MKPIVEWVDVITKWQNYYCTQDGSFLFHTGPGLHDTKKEALAEETKRLKRASLDRTRARLQAAKVYTVHHLGAHPINLAIPDGVPQDKEDEDNDDAY
jgi:hypothetical protein